MEHTDISTTATIDTPIATIHPAWCSTQACDAEHTFPDDRQHYSDMLEVPLSLHMPWRDQEGEWYPYALTIVVTQGVREVEPRVSIFPRPPASTTRAVTPGCRWT